MSKAWAEIKAKLLGQYEAILDEVLRQGDEAEAQTLTGIEELALRARGEVGAQVTAALLERASEQSVPGPRCSHCGGEMHNKGQKRRYLRTRSGDVAVERAYYYCPACRHGIFPPG
jgi:hypothetical protein